MATGSGLDSQVGFKAESVYGTAVTVDKFIEHDGYTLKLVPTWNEPTGLRPGTKFKRGPRARRSRFAINGDVTFKYPTEGMGVLWKQSLGSSIVTPTQIGATTAYKQIHTPGDFLGKSMTMQVGTPEPSSGVVRPRTHAGCKVTGWEFSVTDGDTPTMKVTVVGRSESTATALATATYPTVEVFDFSQATLKLGGTATTASGETTIAGGVAVATIVKAFTITMATPMDVQRYGLGNAGLMAEPLENATPTVTGTLAAEFNKAELYDLFSAGTSVAMQFDLTGSAIGASGSNNLLSFITPYTLMKDAPVDVSGPGIVQMSTSFEAYLDNNSNPVLQVKVVSDETTL